MNQPPQNKNKIEKSVNYIQAGEITACGHCNPKDFGEGLRQAEKVIPNFKCECKCHSTPPESIESVGEKCPHIKEGTLVRSINGVEKCIECVGEEKCNGCNNKDTCNLQSHNEYKARIKEENKWTIESFINNRMHDLKSIPEEEKDMVMRYNLRQAFIAGQKEQIDNSTISVSSSLPSQPPPDWEEELRLRINFDKNKDREVCILFIRSLLSSQLQEHITIIEKYRDWIIDEKQKHLQAERVMLAYDFDSRFVATKQILTKLKEKL